MQKDIMEPDRKNDDDLCWQDFTQKNGDPIKSEPPITIWSSNLIDQK